MKQKFNPKEYLNITEKETSSPYKAKPNNHNLHTIKESVEQVVKEIEERGIDLTSNYGDWLRIGFAFADEFGSQGVSLFHRVSQFYPEYDYKKCQDQFEQCLKSKNQGIAIATFFHYAHEAGINIKKNDVRFISSEKTQETKPEKKDELPTFPDFIFEMLPEFFKKCVVPANNPKERDILLLGSITVVSSCLPNVYGIYDQLTVYPNLFLFITAPASSGKGRVNLCRRLVNSIHKKKREETSSKKVQYEVEMTEYHELKKKDKTLLKPEKPTEQMLFIPANSSATGTFELLNNNEGSGLIFETEGDTLAQAFKSEHGNYSDGFRKAFHHEEISYYRRTDSEYVSIPCPKISTMLTGTPDQVLALMPDSENGLFSRFMFYKLERQKQWKNVFDVSSNQSLDEIYNSLGFLFETYHTKLLSNINRIRFKLTPDQVHQFNEFFSGQYHRFLFLQKEGLEASLFRLGLICYRLAMILSIIRALEDDNIKTVLECEPRDFEISLSITKTLLLHTEEVFLYLPKKKLILPRGKDKKERFLEKLPKDFLTKEYREIACALGISRQTAERYIKQFVNNGLLHKKSHGHYQNILKSKG